MSSHARYPSLQDRAVLTTGGATGIGACLVERFVEQGARAGFIGIGDRAGHALADRLGAGAADNQAAPWVDDAARAEIAKGPYIPRALVADDIARLALFLAAGDSAMCTGQDFVVDAGRV